MPDTPSDGTLRCPILPSKPAMTSRLFFQSCGPVEDGNGRGSVLVNSLESLGFLSVFQACHQIVSVPEDNDDREVRISFSK